MVAKAAPRRRSFVEQAFASQFAIADALAAMPGSDLNPVLTPSAAHDVWRDGHVRTHLRLPSELVQRIQRHFHGLPSSASNYVHIFQSPTSPYNRAVYANHEMLPAVVGHLLKLGLGRHFRTRYMIAAHDIFLSHFANHTGFGRHWDIFRKEQPFEGPYDLTIYIPLTPTSAAAGGRLHVLPGRVATARNATKHPMETLRLLAMRNPGLPLEAFGDARSDDAVAGAMADAMKIANKDMFTARKRNGQLAWRAIATEAPGETILFPQKEFHENEPIRRPKGGVQRRRGGAVAPAAAAPPRDVYVIRLHPLYDVPVKLPTTLRGFPANSHVIDFEQRSIARVPTPIDVSAYPPSDRVWFRF